MIRHHTRHFPEVHGSRDMTDSKILSVPLLCYENLNSSSSQDVKITFKFDGQKFHEILKRGSIVDKAILSVMEKIGLEENECWFACGTKLLRKGTEVAEDLNIDLHIRVKGGECTWIRLADWILKKMKYPLGFFEIINVPASLRSGPRERSYVVCLGFNGRLLLVLVLNCLEAIHATGFSFNGFELEQMYYLRELNVIKIHKSTVPLTPLSYNSDLESVQKEIIDKYLRFENEAGGEEYPMYIQNMVDTREVDFPGYSCRSKKIRSITTNHPCTKHASARIGMFTNLMLKYHSGFLTEGEKFDFEDIMEVGHAAGIMTFWHSRIIGNGVGQDLKDVYQFTHSDGTKKYYSPDYLGRLDFSRCLITHCKRPAVVVEAALYLLWEDQLPELQKYLIVNYPSPPDVLGWRGKAYKPVYEKKPPAPTELDESDDAPAESDYRANFVQPREYRHGATGYILWSSIPERREITIDDIFA